MGLPESKFRDEVEREVRTNRAFRKRIAKHAYKNPDYLTRRYYLLAGEDTNAKKKIFHHKTIQVSPADLEDPVQGNYEDANYGDDYMKLLRLRRQKVWAAVKIQSAYRAAQQRLAALQEGENGTEAFSIDDFASRETQSLSSHNAATSTDDELNSPRLKETGTPPYQMRYSLPGTSRRSFSRERVTSSTSEGDSETMVLHSPLERNPPRSPSEDESPSSDNVLTEVDKATINELGLIETAAQATDKVVREDAVISTEGICSPPYQPVLSSTTSSNATSKTDSTVTTRETEESSQGSKSQPDWIGYLKKGLQISDTRLEYDKTSDNQSKLRMRKLRGNNPNKNSGMHVRIEEKRTLKHQVGDEVRETQQEVRVTKITARDATDTRRGSQMNDEPKTSPKSKSMRVETEKVLDISGSRIRASDSLRTSYATKTETRHSSGPSAVESMVAQQLEEGEANKILMHDGNQKPSKEIMSSSSNSYKATYVADKKIFVSSPDASSTSTSGEEIHVSSNLMKRVSLTMQVQEPGSPQTVPHATNNEVDSSKSSENAEKPEPENQRNISRYIAERSLRVGPDFFAERMLEETISSSEENQATGTEGLARAFETDAESQMQGRKVMRETRKKVVEESIVEEEEEKLNLLGMADKRAESSEVDKLERKFLTEMGNRLSMEHEGEQHQRQLRISRTISDSKVQEHAIQTEDFEEDKSPRLERTRRRTSKERPENEQERRRFNYLDQVSKQLLTEEEEEDEEPKPRPVGMCMSSFDIGNASLVQGDQEEVSREGSLQETNVWSTVSRTDLATIPGAYVFASPRRDRTFLSTADINLESESKTENILTRECYTSLSDDEKVFRSGRTQLSSRSRKRLQRESLGQATDKSGPSKRGGADSPAGKSEFPKPTPEKVIREMLEESEGAEDSPDYEAKTIRQTHEDPAKKVASDDSYYLQYHLTSKKSCVSTGRESMRAEKPFQSEKGYDSDMESSGENHMVMSDSITRRAIYASAAHFSSATRKDQDDLQAGRTLGKQSEHPTSRPPFFTRYQSERQEEDQHAKSVRVRVESSPRERKSSFDITEKKETEGEGLRVTSCVRDVVKLSDKVFDAASEGIIGSRSEDFKATVTCVASEGKPVRTLQSGTDLALSRLRKEVSSKMTMDEVRTCRRELPSHIGHKAEEKSSIATSLEVGHETGTSSDALKQEIFAEMDQAVHPLPASPRDSEVSRTTDLRHWVYTGERIKPRILKEGATRRRGKDSYEEIHGDTNAFEVEKREHHISCVHPCRTCCTCRQHISSAGVCSSCSRKTEPHSRLTGSLFTVGQEKSEQQSRKERLHVQGDSKTKVTHSHRREDESVRIDDDGSLSKRREVRTTRRERTFGETGPLSPRKVEKTLAEDKEAKRTAKKTSAVAAFKEAGSKKVEEEKSRVGLLTVAPKHRLRWATRKTKSPEGKPIIHKERGMEGVYRCPKPQHSPIHFERKDTVDILFHDVSSDALKTMSTSPDNSSSSQPQPFPASTSHPLQKASFVPLSLATDPSFGVVKDRLRIFEDGTRYAQTEKTNRAISELRVECRIRDESSPVILVIGGIDPRDPCNPELGVTVFRLLVSQRKWQVADRPLPQPRNYHAAVSFQNYIVVSGGYNPLDLRNGEMMPTTSVFALDVDINSWMQVASMTVARAHHGMTTCLDRIYVIGGRTETGRPSDTVEYLDPYKNAWVRNVANLPKALMGMAVTCFGGAIYVIGGVTWNEKTKSASLVNTVYRYDPEENRWTSEAPMSRSRAYCAAISLECEIFLFGGSTTTRTGELECLSTVEVFSPSRQCWKTYCSELSSPKHGFAACRKGHAILIFGGMRSDRKKAVRDMDVVDLDRYLVAPGPALPVPVAGSVAVYISSRSKKCSYAAGMTREEGAIHIQSFYRGLRERKKLKKLITEKHYVKLEDGGRARSERAARCEKCHRVLEGDQEILMDNVLTLCAECFEDQLPAGEGAEQLCAIEIGAKFEPTFRSHESLHSETSYYSVNSTETHWELITLPKL